MRSCHPLAYFEAADHAELASAGTFEELRDIGFRVLARMPDDVWMVCGPITSGGLGSLEKNVDRFNSAIDLLSAQGRNVFTQMPFEGPMQRLRVGMSAFESGALILNTFYLPIFRSAKVTTLCFIHDWQTSMGAQWEHERAIELGLKRKYFCENLEFSAAAHVFFE